MHSRTRKRARQVVLHVSLTRTLRGCEVPNEEELPPPIKDGAGNGGEGLIRTDVVTDHEALFSENTNKYSSFSLMFYVTEGSPLGPTALARVGTREWLALA